MDHFHPAPAPAPSPSLDDLGLVGSDPVPELDNLTALAREVLSVPVALLTIVQPEIDRRFFCSSAGLAEPRRSAGRRSLTHALCQKVVRDDRSLVVDDARRDPVVSESSAVDDLGVVGFLGAPVRIDVDGPAIGVLCVIDRDPHEWTDDDERLLLRLGSCVSDVLRARALLVQSETTRAELSTVRDRLADAVAAGGVGLWERDLGTGEFWLSEKYSELHGGATVGWTGVGSLIDRFHPDDRAELEPLMLADREPNRTYEWVYRFLMGDGTYRWMRSRSSLTERPGRGSRLAGATVDITDEREREQRIAQLNARLTDANESLTDFVRIASHDLRSPLRAIRILVGLARDEHPELPAPLIERLDAIDERSASMSNLLDGLFRYLVVGNTEPEPAVVDLGSLADQVFTLVARPDHVSLLAETRAASALVDEFALSTVVRNLVDNAVKHSGEQPSTVKVVFDRHETDSERLVVEVRDTGSGIPEEHRERIFHPFYTLRGDRNEGRGMGLAIVNRLVNRAGGTIEVESVVGEGSTFRVTWPASRITSIVGAAQPVR